MPLFAVWRDLDPLTPAAEREAMTFRSIAALLVSPGVNWLGSYVVDRPDAWRSLCLYDGPDAEEVAFRSTYCQVPFREVREVVETLPDQFGLAQQPEADPGTPLFLVRRSMDRDLTDEMLEAMQFRSAGCLSACPGVRWERSFWDPERKESACVYRAPSAEILRQHADLARISCESVEEVVEVHPREWAGVYDAYGVPKYWETDAR